MKKSIAIALMVLVLICITSCTNGKNKNETNTNFDEKIELILDTDVGADCDDMLALAYIAYAEKNMNVDLKAITCSSSADYGISAIKTFYKDLGMIPPSIGYASKSMLKYDNYCKQIVEKFGTENEYTKDNDAISVLRQALVESEKATICAIGPLSNISALLNSQPDEISALDGKTLLKEKCEKIVIMSGKFENQESLTPEWNTSLDIEASQNVVNNFPAPVYFVSYELGNSLFTGKAIMDKYQYDNPVSMAYMLYPGVIEAGGRPSWDPLSVYFAIGDRKEYLKLSQELTVTINDDGRSYINNEIKSNHYIIYFKDESIKDEISKYFDDCVIALYRSKG